MLMMLKAVGPPGGLARPAPSIISISYTGSEGPKSLFLAQDGAGLGVWDPMHKDLPKVPERRQGWSERRVHVRSAGRPGAPCKGLSGPRRHMSNTLPKLGMLLEILEGTHCTGPMSDLLLT